MQLIYSRDIKAELFKSTMSHDPSGIILICCFAVQETFIIIIKVSNKKNNYKYT